MSEAILAYWSHIQLQEASKSFHLYECSCTHIHLQEASKSFHLYECSCTHVKLMDTLIKMIMLNVFIMLILYIKVWKMENAECDWKYVYYAILNDVNLLDHVCQVTAEKK